MNIDIRTLDDGDGIEATLMRHHASWHKTCRLKFNQTKLERLGMRSTLEEEEEEEGINNKKEGDEKGSLQEEKCKQNEVSAMQTRSSHEIVDLKEAKCFLCDEAAGSAGLHKVSTYDIDMRVRKCAMELEDSSLLAKLAPGDMIALEAKYHRRCLVALYNRARAANSERINEAHDDLHGIAFAELVAFMVDFRAEEGVAPVFKLADLAHLYKTRLEQLSVATEGRVHTSRLKLRLLSVFPDLKAHVQGKKVVLAFDDDIGAALRKAQDHDCDHDAMHLARAAKVVRKEMFQQKFTFNGSFLQGTQQNIIPKSLLALVNMILEGPNIKHQTQLDTTTDVSLSISQLLMFNSVKRSRAADVSSVVHHKRERETPIS